MSHTPQNTIDVRCPHCDAPAGYPCHSRTRRGMLLGRGRRFHADRERYARTGKLSFEAWLRYGFSLAAVKAEVGR